MILVALTTNLLPDRPSGIMILILIALKLKLTNLFDCIRTKLPIFERTKLVT
jgi:hypothetical protein